MSQAISVVVPVYDGVTQLDFTGPHQFSVAYTRPACPVASLGGETGYGGPPHLFEPGRPGCDRVVRRAPGARRRWLPRCDREYLFVKEIARLGSPRAI